MKALEFVLKLNDQVTTPLDKIQRGFTDLEVTLTRVQKQLTGIARLIRKMPKADFGKFTGFGGDFAAGFRGGGAASRARASANPVPMLALPAPSRVASKVVAKNVIDVVAKPVPTREINKVQRQLDRLRGLAKIPLSLVPTRAKAIDRVRGQLDRLRGASARAGQSLMRELTVRRSVPASFRNLRREMFSTERSAQRLGGVMRGVWSVPTALATGAGAFGLGQFGRFATGATVAQQQRVVSLTNLTKGSAYSTPQALMDSLEGFYLQNPAFSFADTINQYRQFRNAGFEDNKARRQMELAAGMVAAGYTPDAINRLTYAKSQILTSGTLYGGEVQQINDIISMPELRQNIADILNTRDGTNLGVSDIKDMQGLGQISSDLALQAINMIEERIGGGMIEQYRNSLPGLFNSTRFLFTKAFQGVETSPLEELLKTVNSLLMEGGGTLEVFQGAVNNLYSKTFGKLAKYLKTLVDDPEKAARAIKKLSEGIDKSISIVTEFGRGIWDVGKGLVDFLSGLKPVFDWLGRLTGSMDEGEVSAARWLGRIAGGILVFNGLMTAIGLAGGAVKLLGGGLSFFFTNPLALFLGGITLWITKFGSVEKLGESIAALMRGEWANAWQLFGEALTAQGPVMIEFFDDMYDKIGWLVDGVIGFINKVNEGFEALNKLNGANRLKAQLEQEAASAGKSIELNLRQFLGLGGGSSGGRTSTNVNQEVHIHQQPGESAEAAIDRGMANFRQARSEIEMLNLRGGGTAFT